MVNVRDDNALRAGKNAQRRAQLEFSDARFEIALKFYKDAERFYSIAFHSPGDRMFFAQATALRCLEELVESGRLDLMNEWHDRLSAFRANWTMSAILEQITPERQVEGLAFLQWRESAIFEMGWSKALQAQGLGDFEAAKNIFLSIAEDENPSQDDGLSALARARAETMAAVQERGKPESIKDFSAIAASYERAAECSTLNATSKSPHRGRVAVYKNWLLAEANSYHAFAKLREPRNSIGAILAAYTDAQALFKKVVSYTRAVRASTVGFEYSQRDGVYAQFCSCVLDERIGFIRYLESGDERFISSAKIGLRVAEQSIEGFEPDRIYPNQFFYSPKDMELEVILLDAAMAMVKKEWKPCHVLLSKWLAEFPEEYLWSLRYVQVKQRVFLLQALIANVDGKPGPIRDALKHMTETAQMGLESTATNAYTAYVSVMAATPGVPLSEPQLHILNSFFCLDWGRLQGSEGDRGFANRLPAQVQDWVNGASAKNDNELELGLTKITAALVAVLTIVCDYYSAITKTYFKGSNDVLDLASTASALLCAHEGKKSDKAAIIGRLTSDFMIVSEAGSRDSFNSSIADLVGTVRRMTSILPSEIEVSSEHFRSLGRRYNVAYPAGAPQRLRERSRIWIDAGDKELLPGKAFLPHDWLSRGRTCLRLSRKYSLVPVTTEPSWKYWVDEIALAGWALNQGVQLAHIRRAIELAERSITPVGGDIQPKVGAVIVKDGRVLAEASRNEDEQGSHAEELALRKVRLEDRHDLRGATVITTLEPCITARRPDKMECTGLLLKNGVGKVIVGLLDPNRNVQGFGYGTLFENNVIVEMFPDSLARILWRMNEEFFKHHSSKEFEQFHMPRK